MNSPGKDKSRDTEDLDGRGAFGWLGAALPSPPPALRALSACLGGGRGDWLSSARRPRGNGGFPPSLARPKALPSTWPRPGPLASLWVPPDGFGKESSPQTPPGPRSLPKSSARPVSLEACQSLVAATAKIDGRNPPKQNWKRAPAFAPASTGTQERRANGSVTRPAFIPRL